ncbi:MAG: methyltransferase [Planctomycetota bacterium]|nr:methyltransferase [Planctomycetota bacterium]
MSPTAPNAPIPSLPPFAASAESAGLLRSALDAAGFDDAGLAKAIGATDQAEARKVRIGLRVFRTSAGRPIDTLLRLFLLGMPVDEAAAERALAPLGVDRGVREGLLARTDAGLMARVQILCRGGVLMATDRAPRAGTQLSGIPENFVMGIGASTLTVAHMLPSALLDRPITRALDLGCGAGYLALALAKGGLQHVAAVDLNPRCLEYARFNAHLNRLPNVWTGQGDLFAPARSFPALGPGFDLIASNPPFVITPGKSYVFRDAGLGSDSLTGRVIREAPACLAEGGLSIFMTNWVQPKGQDWKDHLRSWFTGTGCDALVLDNGPRSPDEYASFWIAHTEGDDVEAEGQMIRTWVEEYERQNIEMIHGGIIIMRKRTAPTNWVEFDTTPDTMPTRAGNHVLRCIAANDLLQEPDLDSLVLVPAPDLRLTHELVPTPEARGGWTIDESRLRLIEGLAPAGGADPVVVRFVGLLNGVKTLGAIIAELAQEFEASPDKLGPSARGVARKMLQRGMLIPASAKGR